MILLGFDSEDKCIERQLLCPNKFRVSTGDPAVPVGYTYLTVYPLPDDICRWEIDMSDPRKPLFFRDACVSRVPGGLWSNRK